MAQILEKLKILDSSNSEDVKSTLSQFFQYLVGKKGNFHSTFQTLQHVINRFPKYCISHRETIEHYLKEYLDSNNYFLVIEAAKCAHILQQVRPSHEKTATAKSSWRSQLSLLCDAAHALITAIFPDAVDIYKNGGGFENKAPPAQEVQTSPIAVFLTKDVLKNMPVINLQEGKQAALSVRLNNVLIFIQAMLVEVYPVAKPVRPQAVLDVIVRALSVSSAKNCNLNDNIIADIKIEALKTMDALVVCLGSNLIPFSSLVFRSTMQTIRWSSDKSSQDFNQVRCQAYSSLTKWLTTLHSHKPEVTRSGGRGKCFEDDLVANIIQDVTPPKHVVQVTSNVLSSKNLSKKAKRKLANAQLQESSIASHIPGEKSKINESLLPDDAVANAALECAETFLTVCGLFLKPMTHKILQERLVVECYNIEKYSEGRVLMLCRAIEAARKSSPTTVPPPTQYCIQLYSSLINHSCTEISKLCSQGLLDIRLHLHCSQPSLNFVPDISENNSTQQNKNKMSEKNFEVLQSLLGAPRVSSITADIKNTKELIEICDEPANKKARGEPTESCDISDNISIKSHSSVEISDDNDSVELTSVDIHTMPTQAPKRNIESVYSKGVDNIKKSTSDVHEVQTQIENILSDAIHEMQTQVENISSDAVDGNDSSPNSIEVSYDHENTNTDNVRVIEEIDDDNLPSTSDTDDIQITCGQVVRNSQISPTPVDIDCIIVESENKSKNHKNCAESSDIAKEIIDICDNFLIKKNSSEGVITENGTDNTVLVKDNTEKNATLTVDEMMADFVDEIVEEE